VAGWWTDRVQYGRTVGGLSSRAGGLYHVVLHTALKRLLILKPCARLTLVWTVHYLHVFQDSGKRGPLPPIVRHGPRSALRGSYLKQ
jgi:hypothetical protein